MISWIEKGYIMPWRMFKNVIRTMPALAITMAKHPRLVIQQHRGEKVKWFKSKPSYEIPEYKEGMKFCKSNERYLRPTHLCNSHAKEIIAMANELGAFKKDDWEYAESVFNFVKRNIKLAFVPMTGVVETLKNGCGTCVHQLSLFAALCRAGGLKARYHLYTLALIEPMYKAMVEVSPIVKGWYDAFGTFMLHGTAQVMIDGKWVVADPTFTPADEAAMGIPIAKLGDEPTGIWNYPVKDTEVFLEGLPYGVGIGWDFFVKILGPKEAQKVNESLERERKKGEKILQEMGEENYDRMVREKYKAKIPKITLEKCPNIVFK
ncbi:MAG: transglutaminase family protein [Candidatus Thermoplasmatota archaeon]